MLFIVIRKVSVPVREAYILEVLALAVSIILTYVTHERTRSSSSLLLLFWPAYTIGIIIWARTVVTTRESSDAFSVLAPKCVLCALGFIDVVLECMGPESTDPSGHENPIVTANVYSRWTFQWMTPLMKKGALRYIDEDDLPTLLPKDESAKLTDDLKKAMDK